MNEESGFVNCTSAWLYFLLRCYRRVCLCWWSRESGLCYKESLCSRRPDLGPKPKRFSFVSKKTCTLSLYAPRSTNYRWAKESWLERASKREKHREGMTIDGSLLLQEKKKDASFRSVSSTKAKKTSLRYIHIPFRHSSCAHAESLKWKIASYIYLTTYQTNECIFSDIVRRPLR